MGEPVRRFSSPWSSVRARTTTAATVVVALALTATGMAVLETLHHNLVESASVQAEGNARDLLAQLETGTEFARLRFPDPDDEPAQVVSPDGIVLAADEELAISGPIADFTPQSGGGGDQGGSGGEGDDEESDEEEDDDEEEEADDGEEGSGSTGPAGAREEIGGAGGVSQQSVGSSARTTDQGAADAGTTATEEITFSEVSLTMAGSEAPENFRVAALPATTTTGQPVIIYAAASLDTAESAVADARRAMLIGLPLLLAVVAAVTWLVTRRALRPVEAIRSELAEIMHGDLSRRVPEPRSRDEIGRLAVTTNETLAALEKSSERQRRFIADAAHELRSPIASLRTQLEVAQAHPDLLEMDGVLGDTVRIQQLATDLLLLARLDAGEQPRADRVDLTALIEEELAHRIGDRIPVESALPEAAVEVTGSRTQLARVLGNLVDNAQRHAASTVRVGLGCRAGTAIMEVVDDGSGVPEADRERIFQRFVRLDEARSRDDGGAGLGLAIVRDVVQRHGGVIRVEGAPQGGARFIVELPIR
ncbi:HAMP domain-containing histidine kinase [Nocardia cyriacigeorgica]|nr:HAMP domain-containing histidine kinase [Nocardia cyriacigeorgica]